MPTPQVLMRLSPTPSMKPYPKNLIPLAALLISPIDLPQDGRRLVGGNVALIRQWKEDGLLP